MARRQGRMALAVLGKPWFNRRETDVPDTFEFVRHRLETDERLRQYHSARRRAEVARVTTSLESACVC